MDQLFDEKIAARIQGLLADPSVQATDTFGSRLKLEYLRAEGGTYFFSARTEEWMCNLYGAVHGGICAAFVDQAMGLMAYCLKDGEHIAPTIQLQVSYHRPLMPKKDVLIKVRTVSATKHLITMAAEVAYLQKPESSCFSGTATFFCKDRE